MSMSPCPSKNKTEVLCTALCLSIWVYNLQMEEHRKFKFSDSIPHSNYN